MNHKKMKITLFAIFSVNAEDLEAASSQAAPRFPVVSSGSRLSRKFTNFRNMWLEYGYTPQQLTNVIFLSILVPIFILFQLYGYGCYCLNLGGSPMSGLNELNGVKPMDDIDRTCFHWTRCNRCAAIDHGEKCKAEDRSYDFEIDPDTKDITCKGKKSPLYVQKSRIIRAEKKNTCKWAICECDKEQVLSMKQFVDKMTPDSRLLNHNGFNPQEQCQKRESSRIDSGMVDMSSSEIINH